VLHQKGALMNILQIAAALKYLQRVTARGVEEEQELYALIQALSNALHNAKPVYTTSGTTAA
jgi:hypothetical protein